MPIPTFPFFIAALALAAVPGPGIAYVVARTVAGGRSEGIASSLGTACGGMLHVLLSALGLSLIIAESPALYAVMRYVGAAYLLFLGLRILLTRQVSTGVSSVARSGTRKAFTDGVIVEAMNVKTAMFFIAFIPQFVSSSSPFGPQFVLLGTICVFLNTCADLVAVFAASRFLASGDERARRELMLARVSGAVMIALSAFVAFSPHGR